MAYLWPIFCRIFPLEILHKSALIILIRSNFLTQVFVPVLGHCTLNSDSLLPELGHLFFFFFVINTIPMTACLVHLHILFTKRKVYHLSIPITIEICCFYNSLSDKFIWNFDTYITKYAISIIIILHITKTFEVNFFCMIKCKRKQRCKHVLKLNMLKIIQK